MFTLETVCWSMWTSLPLSHKIRLRPDMNQHWIVKSSALPDTTTKFCLVKFAIVCVLLYELSSAGELYYVYMRAWSPATGKSSRQPTRNHWICLVLWMLADTSQWITYYLIVFKGGEQNHRCRPFIFFRLVLQLKCSRKWRLVNCRSSIREI